MTLRSNRCGKIGFETPQQAWQAINAEKQRRRRSRSTRKRGVNVTVYKCPRCRQHHITGGKWGSLADLE